MKVSKIAYLGAVVWFVGHHPVTQLGDLLDSVLIPQYSTLVARG